MGDNTTIKDQNIIEVTPHSTFDTDWDSAVDLGQWIPAGEVRIKQIIFEPSGADTLVIKSGSDAGPICFKVSTADGNSQKTDKFDPPLRRIVIDASDCSLTSPANARIILKLGD